MMSGVREVWGVHDVWSEGGLGGSSLGHGVFHIDGKPTIIPNLFITCPHGEALNDRSFVSYCYLGQYYYRPILLL